MLCDPSELRDAAPVREVMLCTALVVRMMSSATLVVTNGSAAKQPHMSKAAGVLQTQPLVERLGVRAVGDVMYLRQRSRVPTRGTEWHNRGRAARVSRGRAVDLQVIEELPHGMHIQIVEGGNGRRMLRAPVRF